MNIPKRHHYVPQMLLKHFTDERGYLYYFDKSREAPRVRKGAPLSLFKKDHLYSSLESDGTRDASLEMAFSKLVSDCA